MSYVALARRYRSRTFSEVVGQDAIAHTLEQAVVKGRTAHAYLFCGTRGVGKTSMARIFAKSLNVTENLSEREAIEESILRGEDMDVIEIDGASNRGVQEARDIIAAAGLSPARCDWRIYIIDEVHMLTRDAFNALLKTMEEPPSHVKFILCTTEPQKVPATIQSRCQRFDFKSISSSLISSHLKKILESEGVTADPEVLAEVSRLGDGSMRDAISILDRLLAAGDGALTVESMETMLGLPSRELLDELVSSAADGHPEKGIIAASRLLEKGITCDQALQSFSSALRLRLIASVCGSNSELLDVSQDILESLVEDSRSFYTERLVHLIALCESAARQCRNSESPRALFDATIVRVCLDSKFDLIEEGSFEELSQKKKKNLNEKKINSLKPIKNSKKNGSSGVSDSSSPEDIYKKILDSIASVSEKAKLKLLRPVSWDQKCLVLEVDLSKPGARFIFEDLKWIEEYGKNVGVSHVKVQAMGNSVKSKLSHEEEALTLPGVKEFLDMFDAKVLKVSSGEEKNV